MKRTLISFLVFLTAGCTTTPSLDGSYLGDIKESSQITAPAGSPIKGFTEAHTQSQARVTVAAVPGGMLLEAGPTVKVRLQPSGKNAWQVESKQVCEISIGRFRGPLLMSGEVHLESDGHISLELRGAPTEPGMSGGYIYNYKGLRK